MKDTLIFVALLVGWVTLNMWVLPYFGVRTCMSGGCRVPELKSTASKAASEPQNLRESQPTPLAGDPHVPQ